MLFPFLHQINMFCYYHSTTSFPMFNKTSNIFFIGENHFRTGKFSIKSFIKTSYSTHNIFSLEINSRGQSSTFTYSISKLDSNVKFFSGFFWFFLIGYPSRSIGWPMIRIISYMLSPIDPYPNSCGSVLLTSCVSYVSCLELYHYSIFYLDSFFVE